MYKEKQKHISPIRHKSSFNAPPTIVDNRRTFVNQTELTNAIQCSTPPIQKHKNSFEGLLNDTTNRKKEFHVLVYGTEKARVQQRGRKADSEKGEIKAVSSILPEGFVKMEENRSVNWGLATKGFYTADRFNNCAWRDFTYEGDQSYSIFNPKYVKHIVDDKENEDNIKADLYTWTESLSLNADEKEAVKDYQVKLLQHPSYSPIVTYKESEQFIRRLESQQTTQNAEELAKNRFDLQTRRGCKFGLEYMKNLPQERSKLGEIAFLSSVHGAEPTGKPEPINSESILNKTTTTSRAGGKQGEARVPITTIEQRKLFRIRSGFSGIHFINSAGEAEKAPWNKKGPLNHDGWMEYEQYRYNKYLLLANDLNLEDIEKYTVDGLKKCVIEKLKKLDGYETLSPNEAITKYISDKSLDIKKFSIRSST